MNQNEEAAPRFRSIAKLLDDDVELSRYVELCVSSGMHKTIGKALDNAAKEMNDVFKIDSSGDVNQTVANCVAIQHIVAGYKRLAKIFRGEG